MSQRSQLLVLHRFVYKDGKLTVLFPQDCYALFGFSPGLDQNGFSGVMISCSEQIVAGKGSG